MAEARDPVLLRLIGRLLGVAIVVATAAMAVVVYRMLYDEPRTDDAFVRANTIGIAPHVAGPIVALPIVDNQRVAAGDLLFARLGLEPHLGPRAVVYPGLALLLSMSVWLLFFRV